MSLDTKVFTAVAKMVVTAVETRQLYDGSLSTLPEFQCNKTAGLRVCVARPWKFQHLNGEVTDSGNRGHDDSTHKTSKIKVMGTTHVASFTYDPFDSRARASIRETVLILARPRNSELSEGKFTLA
jgi:hypothetical protein